MIASRATLRPRSARLAALLLAGTAIAGLPIVTANADDWTGATSSDWFTASNWADNATPTASNTVTIATTTPNPTVINGSNAVGLVTYVGSYSGAGQLTISGAGVFTTTNGLFVGDSSTPGQGSGSALVTGTGSLLTTGSTVYVGYGAGGVLTIASGGVVDASDVIAGVDSDGTINVEGTGSTLIAHNSLTLYGDTGTDPAGILALTNGGAAISLGDTVIGEYPGNATATIDGAGSSLTTAKTLTIGASGGSGSLKITNGGTAWTGGTTVLGDEAGSSGTLTVSDANSELTTQLLTVGNLGTGTVKISNGGSIASVYGDVAAAAGSTGDVTVDGAKSTWFNASGLAIGDKGKGTLTIKNGGSVFGQDAYIGVAAGSMGTVLVTGAGSAWNLGALEVGGDNNSIVTDSLAIENGGAVSSTLALVGNYAHSTATVTVDGANSSWTTASDLLVGAMNFSSGTLTVSNGGSVSADENLYVGYAPDSTGTLTISNAGKVSVTGDFSVATQSNSTGTLNIGAAVGDAAVAPGIVDAATVAFGTGTGTINFNHTSNSYIFAPQISGSGTINQIAGTTDLATNSLSFTGTLNITGGRLVVDAVLPNGLAVVSGGGILAGNGVVGGIDAESGGIVAPGNGDGIGTLKVNGNVAFVSGSTYQVELNPVGASDQIIGSGTALLIGGTVQVLPAFGGYGASTQYTILTAAGGVFGSFADVSGTPFLSYDLTYDPDDVYLDVARNNTSFASVGATPNQIAAGAGVESLGSGSIVYDAIEVLPTVAAAQAAFDQLSGEIHASTKGMLLDDSHFIRDAATSRIDAAFGDAGAVPLPVMAYGDGGPEVAAADTDRFAVWGQAFGSWGNTNSDGNAAAFDRSTGGLLVGADTLAGGWRVGVLAGYSHSSFSVDDRDSSGSSDNYHLGLYGGSNWGAIAFRGGAAYSWSSISTNRSVSFNGFADQLSANYDAGTAQMFGELAYKIDASKFTFEPFANLAYVNVRTDGFSENGGEAALTSAASNTNATFTTLGLRGSTGFMLGGIDATARGMLGWRHAFGDVTPTSTFAMYGGDAFTIAGVPIARDAAVAEAGFDLKMAANATLGLSYSGQFGGGTTDNGAKVDLSVKF